MSAITRVVSSRSGLRAAYAELPTGTVRAVVPTMGALHSGHAQLIRAARALVGQAGHVTVTVFVNPTQFAAGEDLDRYPRSFDSDVEVCAAEGILPAIESSHAFAGAKRWARQNPGKRVLIGLSGRGDKDMPTLQRTLLKGVL